MSLSVFRDWVEHGLTPTYRDLGGPEQVSDLLLEWAFQGDDALTLEVSYPPKTYGDWVAVGNINGSAHEKLTTLRDHGPLYEGFEQAVRGLRGTLGPCANRGQFVFALDTGGLFLRAVVEGGLWCTIVEKGQWRTQLAAVLPTSAA